MGNLGVFTQGILVIRDTKIWAILRPDNRTPYSNKWSVNDQLPDQLLRHLFLGRP